MSLLEEQLRQIEARACLTDEAETLGFTLTEHERDARDLLAEVHRLRERQEDHDLANEAIRWKREALRLRDDIEMFIEHPTWHRGMYGCPRDMVSTDRLIDLLNPTEGES